MGQKVLNLDLGHSVLKRYLLGNLIILLLFPKIVWTFQLVRKLSETVCQDVQHPVGVASIPVK